MIYWEINNRVCGLGRIADLPPSASLCISRQRQTHEWLVTWPVMARVPRRREWRLYICC